MIPSSVTDKVVARDGDHCRYCGDLVLPTAMPTPIGLTFDLVDPAGPMTVENIVVACRRCNTRKVARTLAAAGMTLRPPIPSGVTRSASAAPRSSRNLEWQLTNARRRQRARAHLIARRDPFYVEMRKTGEGKL